MRCTHLGFAALVAGVLGPALFAEVTIMDEIVCKVNGDIITRSELERARQDLRGELQQQGLTGQGLQDELKKQEQDLLRGRIDDLLLEQRGKEMDLKVDTQLNKYIADLQRKTKIADPDKFQAFVRDQMNMPYEDYRAMVKNQMLKQQVISEEVTRKIASGIKTEELRAYYDAHHDEFERQERVVLSEIFVSTAGLDAAGQAAAEKKAKDLVARANKGESFADLAMNNSDNPATASQGGQLPPFTKNGDKGDHLSPELEALVWNKDKGFVTDPIKLDSGWEILRVNDHQKAGLATFEEAQGDVENKVLEPRYAPALRAYLTKLRESAFLEIKAGYVDTGAAPNKDTSWVNPADLKPETIKKEEILNQTRHKHLFGVIPLPGTSTPNTGTSSSR